ncbi:PREDICTED: brain acid soluble protein 1-like [Erythranthe guttata]|uniref:brain acid soluble protein 1-like n=1 Tax=Erythranthe guttata TaxID=4155 RepID=UPI00064D7F01|nr:PREDICTED: brain acid soluble protein 1-like [Erythranthe guttata]|eukprot:XP_012837807.1 PREDICTED: brain acid soluble protein 1-like [Erythranthe guttata]
MQLGHNVEGEEILPAEAAEVEKRGGKGGRTPVRPNPQRGLHLVDEETDDEEGDPTFAEPEAQVLSSSSSESSSNDSIPPASTQGETSQSNMAAAPSQHPVSEDVAAHVPEDVVAPTVSANVSQSAAEDAAPYQDEEMPDFSGMSSAEHVDIPSVDAQDFTTTEETPSAPHADPLEALAEAAVQVDASPPQADEPEKKSDSDSSEDSSQMQEDAAPRVASPEPAYISDELEDSEEEESSEE